MKIKRFHQFVGLERGPVHTLAADFLKGEVFQVENVLTDAFLEGRHEEIPEFVAGLEAEELLLETEEGAWIPPAAIQEEDPEETPLIMDVAEGVNLELLRERFKEFPVKAVTYYGADAPEIFPGVETRQGNGDFELCRAQCVVDGAFQGVDERSYDFNKRYNRCWGRRVAVTADHQVRPCIHASVSAGCLDSDDPERLLEKLKEFWTLNGDKIEKCRPCEFRYVCSDCRELALRETGDILAPNPTCRYNPRTGAWEEQKNNGLTDPVTGS